MIRIQVKSNFQYILLKEGAVSDLEVLNRWRLQKEQIGNAKNVVGILGWKLYHTSRKPPVHHSLTDGLMGGLYGFVVYTL